MELIYTIHLRNESDKHYQCHSRTVVLNLFEVTEHLTVEKICGTLYH